MASEAPQLQYWHVYTNQAGQSVQERRTLTGFSSESMGGDADPQWNLHVGSLKTHILFAELPAGFVGEWHENPRPQFIIPLSGGWWVETQDGTRVEMQTGELSFGADQGTQPNNSGHRGHRSGALGNSPCKMMIVQLLDENYKGISPAELQARFDQA